MMMKMMKMMKMMMIVKTHTHSSQSKSHYMVVVDMIRNLSK